MVFIVRNCHSQWPLETLPPILLKDAIANRHNDHQGSALKHHRISGAIRAGSTDTAATVSRSASVQQHVHFLYKQAHKLSL
jgi:hypothetical protein